jgi:fibronectin-binding autotransporter adhesin
MTISYLTQLVSSHSSRGDRVWAREGFMSGSLQTAVVRTWPLAATETPRILARSLMVTACVLATSATSLATDYSWLGGSGRWDTASNWTPNGAPTTGDTVDVNGPSGTVVDLLTTAGSSGIAITVRSGNTLRNNGLDSTSTQRLGSGSTLSNAGTIENAYIQQGNAITNTGIIQATGTGKFMGLTLNFNVGGMTNTGGTLRAINGGTLRFYSSNPVTGGTLSIDSTSRLQLISGNGFLALNNLTGRNDGTMTFTMNLDVGGNRSVAAYLNGTTIFDNYGGIDLSLVSPTGSQSGTKSAQMVVASTATFTNRSTGTLSILNSTTQSTGTSSAYFQMDATGFNNQGGITISTTGTSVGTAQFRAPNVDFSNAGSITVDGPLSSIQMAGRTLTQTAGSLSLINGSTMTAGAVLINGGTLLGTGTIAAPVTIGGVVAPGNGGIGTLSVTDTVTWNAGKSWLFQLGAAAPSLAAATAATDSDLLDVVGAFDGTGSGFTFDFAGTGSDGWYKLVDYTTTSFTSGSSFQATNVPAGKTANFTVDSGSSALYVQIVPEPTTVILAAVGLGILAYAASRRPPAMGTGCDHSFTR